MEVSHVKDHVTHAVIGGGHNIGFGISDSAEFFNILSSTLYKDQKLAVVREVLCNAWDAHIAAGKQDVPVQITLTRDEFVIRDYGLGIPHDMIGPIYTVYGNSTKKHDGKQTGGFGLGCKAPFAYTDHFEVTSWCGSKKSIYNVSKSAAEVMGKPGMKLIVQSECGAETGIQVRIKLKDSEDRNTFYALIETIVRNGEMNMEMNHTKLDVLPFSQMPLDFMITTKELLSNTRSDIMLRYGNVIYPLSDDKAFTDEYKDVAKIMQVLDGRHGHRYQQQNYFLVLQAPPHSISVTPNREELSMQEHTVKTLKTLLDNFAKRFHRDYEGEALKLLDQCLDETWKKKDINEILCEEERIPGNVNKDLGSNNQITTMPTLVRYHVSKQYPKIAGYKKLELLKRIDSMLVNGWGNRGLLQAYRNLVQATNDPSYHAGVSDQKWFYKHIVSPLVRGMDQNESLDPNRLFALGYGIRGGDYRLTSSKFSKDMIRSVNTLEALPVIKYWPFLRNIVVISYTRNDVAERLRRFPQITEKGGLMNYGVMLYIVPRNSARLEAVRKHFQSKHGVVLMDLTVAAGWEHKAIAEPEARVYVRKKKQAGWPAVTSIMNTVGGTLLMDMARQESAARIETPLWYTFLEPKTKNTQTPQHLGRFNSYETKAVLKLFGSTGAIALTKASELKLIEAGAAKMEDFVRDQIIEEVSSSERIGRHLSEKQAMANMDGDDDHLRMICEVKMLRDIFGLGESIDDRDQSVLKLWDDVKSYCVHGYRSNHLPALELEQAIQNLEPPPVLLDLMARIKASELLEFLDVNYLTSTFSKGKDAGLIKRALNLYLQALNN